MLGQAATSCEAILFQNVANYGAELGVSVGLPLGQRIRQARLTGLRFHRV